MNSTSNLSARFGIIFGVLLLAVSPYATGQFDTHKSDSPCPITDAGKTPSTTKIVYRPPQRSAPVRRVSGGTRTPVQNQQ